MLFMAMATLDPAIGPAHAAAAQPQPSPTSVINLDNRIMPSQSASRSGLDAECHHYYPDSSAEYIYALQWTATVNVSPDHSGCGVGDNEYDGWLGIDGRITTPSVIPTLEDPYHEHNVGWIGAYSIATDQWLQIGWYTGTIGGTVSGACPIGTCVQRPYSLGLYVETMNGATGDYRVYDISPLSQGSTVTYRVNRESDGCWHAYYNYSTPALTSCGLPSSMAMYAVNELYKSTSSTFTQMGSSTFGTAASGTNETLRLKGATGWRDWTQSVNTRQSDVRNQASFPVNYYMSSAKLWWNLITYQGPKT